MAYTEPLFSDSDDKFVAKDNDKLEYACLRLERERHQKHECPFHYYTTKQVSANGDFILLATNYKSHVLQGNANGLKTARILAVSRYIGDNPNTRGKFAFKPVIAKRKTISDSKRLFTEYCDNKLLDALLSITRNTFFTSPLDIIELQDHISAELKRTQARYDALIDSLFEV